MGLLSELICMPALSTRQDGVKVTAAKTLKNCCDFQAKSRKFCPLCFAFEFSHPYADRWAHGSGVRTCDLVFPCLLLAQDHVLHIYSLTVPVYQQLDLWQFECMQASVPFTV